MNHLDKLDEHTYHLVAKYVANRYTNPALKVLGIYSLGFSDLKELDKVRPVSKNFLVREAIKHGSLDDIIEVYKNDSIDSHKFAELVELKIKIGHYNEREIERYPEFIQKKIEKRKQKLHDEFMASC